MHFFQRFYLFTFRRRGREGERERNINVWLPLARPLLETWPQQASHSKLGKAVPPNFSTSEGLTALYFQ